MSEMINLKEDVDLENKILHIEGERQGQDIPISDKLHKILTNYLKILGMWK